MEKIFLLKLRYHEEGEIEEVSVSMTTLDELFHVIGTMQTKYGSYTLTVDQFPDLFQLDIYTVPYKEKPKSEYLGVI
jgi:hypothetical protein